jgi:hypothetical protein
MEMQENISIAQLEQTFTQYEDNLDKAVLPKLKEDLRIIHSAFKTIHSILLKKGFLHEDPYKDEIKVSEITIPSSEFFPDSEKTDQMSIRLSSYEVQLDFLLNYYQFSMEFLDISRIRLIAGLLRYINWDQIGPTAQDPISKAMGELITRVKQGGDPLSVGLLNDSLDQIYRTIPHCFRPLKDITEFSKETYKMTIRTKAFPSLSVKPGSPPNKEDIQKQIKKCFPSVMPKQPFYPELVSEVIEEEYGADGPKLKEALLQKFTIKAVKSKDTRQQISFPAMLRDAIKTMATASRPLEDAARKLVENNTLMQIKKSGFVEKFKQWLAQIANKQEEDKQYEVEYFDNATSSTKREKILFEAFITDIQKRARIFNGIIIKGGTLYNRMEKADEETLYAFLDKQMGDLALAYRRLQGLDTFFKNAVGQEQKANLRGIKIELTAINNSLVRANQKKHEYIARKDESEQMKRLGIK